MGCLSCQRPVHIAVGAAGALQCSMLPVCVARHCVCPTVAWQVVRVMQCALTCPLLRLYIIPDCVYTCVHYQLMPTDCVKGPPSVFHQGVLCPGCLAQRCAPHLLQLVLPCTVACAVSWGKVAWLHVGRRSRPSAQLCTVLGMCCHHSTCVTCVVSFAEAAGDRAACMHMHGRLYVVVAAQRQCKHISQLHDVKISKRCVTTGFTDSKGCRLQTSDQPHAMGL